MRSSTTGAGRRRLRSTATRSRASAPRRAGRARSRRRRRWCARATSWCRRERYDAAIDVADAAAGRFGEDPSTAIAECVTNALLNKGMALRELGRGDEALRVYAEAARRVEGRAGAGAARERRARALRPGLDARPARSRGGGDPGVCRGRDAVRVGDRGRGVRAAGGGIRPAGLGSLRARPLRGGRRGRRRARRAPRRRRAADHPRASVAWGLAGKVGALRELGRIEEALSCLRASC